MAISVATDLVSDVIKAVDQNRARAAHAKLAGANGAQGFETLMASEIPQPLQVRHLSHDMVLDVMRNAGNAERGIEKLASLSSDSKAELDQSMEQLEALLLGQAVEQMLPKNTETVFGTGTAGNVWRSLFADAAGEEIAAASQIAFVTTPQAVRSETSDSSGQAEWPYFPSDLKINAQG